MERRIELWLSTCLEEHYNATQEGMVDSNSLSEMLDGLLKHAQYTKVQTSSRLGLHIHLLLLETHAYRRELSAGISAHLGRSE